MRPRARLERAAYCLGGTFPTSPDVAQCRLTSALAAAKIAGRRLTSPYAGGRWLPVWLPGIPLATLTSERSAPYALPGMRPQRTASSGLTGPAGPCTPAWLSPDTNAGMAWTPQTGPAATGTRSAAARVTDGQQCPRAGRSPDLLPPASLGRRGNTRSA